MGVAQMGPPAATERSVDDRSGNGPDRPGDPGGEVCTGGCSECFVKCLSVPSAVSFLGSSRGRSKVVATLRLLVTEKGTAMPIMKGRNG